MQARPTAVISLVPVKGASLLTWGESQSGMERHSLRMLKDSWLIAPSRRVNRVVYSLSSRDVWD